MAESKSTSNTIDVYSVCFKNCRSIYPCKLVRPLGRYKVDNRKYLGQVLEDITANGFRITQFIGDNPKRSNAKECKCFSSWYPCEYCYAKGTKLQVSDNSNAKKKLVDQINLIAEKIEDCKKKENTPENSNQIENLESLKEDIQKSINAFNRKTNILWPASTMNCQPRSRNSILNIIEKLENNEELSIDEAKGITGRSLLLNLPDFNFVYDSPAEYLHSGCLGLVKRLVELTFNVGEKRSRVTTRKLSSPAAFNKLMANTKVPREFPRRARNLDFAVFKGQEFRNISIFFFPLVIDCIEINFKERHLWLYLAYMMRSAVIPSQEFEQIDIPLVNELCKKFYEMFEELFGMQNCTYNTHTFCSHLMEIRTHGPLTETSAFKFESFYGEMRRSFVAGTVSPMKQILKKILLKRTLRNHSCTSNIYVSNYDTSLESNNLVYTYSRKNYEIFQISEIDNDIITCKYPAQFNETPTLNWSSVGVFKKGGVSSIKRRINSDEICGKVLNVGKYLITCPINILNKTYIIYASVFHSLNT